jgi:predicted esterase
MSLPNFANATPSCTPFGNPPAILQTGWFARLLTRQLPLCRRGELLGPWVDSDGTQRYACRYAPASTTGPLPMVVFLHPSLMTADSAKFLTNLTSFTDSADLGASRPGFILLAPEGRVTTHYYPAPDDAGLGWDDWYRQLDPAGDVKVGTTVYRENADAAAIDHFIAEEISAGRADPKRVYLSGWSNGGSMAMLYALNRPGIAAAGVYSAPSPYGAFSDPCPQVPSIKVTSDKESRIFNPHLAVLHIQNDCDLSGLCVNGAALKDQLVKVGVEFDDVILDYARRQVASCDLRCGNNPFGDTTTWRGNLVGFYNHSRWPSSWTPALLDFFRRHPLPDSG